MPNYKPRHLPEIGRNLKAMREELGLTLREVGEMLGVDHATIARHEERGFYEPPWARYNEIYRAHPDLRDVRDVTYELGRPDLLRKSPLYNQLMGLYGRDNLAVTLAGLSDEEVLQEIGEKCQAWNWSSKDILCIRIRLGIVKRGRGGKMRVACP